MRRAVAKFFILAISFATASFAYRTSAWVPAWDSNALTSVQLNAGKLDEANPGWYTVVADGSIAKNWNAENPTWLAAMSGLDILPTIKNYDDAIGRFNGDLVAQIVNDPQKREAHAENITQLVVLRAYSGIDIDYEAVPAASRAGLTQFLSTLAAKLHAAGKKLSVTVHAKTSDGDDWKGPGAQDYAQIGQHADSVKIMAYDFHWNGSEAGPISPLQWLEQVTAYAVKTIPAEKVLVGLPWYGYDWVGTRATGITFREASNLITTNNLTVGRNADGEATFTYGNHVVFFQDATSYRRKVEMLTAKFPGIGGFAHWRTGAEDPEIWQTVGQMRLTGGSGATPAPVPLIGEFQVSGPAAVQAIAGRSTTASYTVIPSGGFDANVSVNVDKLDFFSGTAKLSRTLMTAGTATTLRITPDANAKKGTYRVRIRFSSGPRIQDQIVTVTIASTRARSARR